MSQTKFEHLFSPIQVGPMLVPNRICETTNGMGASKTGFLDEFFIAHHVGKARGGTGWIGSETWELNSLLPPEVPEDIDMKRGWWSSRQMIYQMPGFAESVKNFCDEVHKAGSVAVFQLTQLQAALVASPVPSDEDSDWVPRAMNEEEIEFMFERYADAAALAQAAGADGIEIHCAHDTVPQTFLSPGLNFRTDRWGGGPQERIRFVVEALERIRKRIGRSLAVGIRIAGTEMRQFGYDNLELREMVYAIGQTGLIDFLDLDVGHSFGDHAYVAPSYCGNAEYREVGKAARADLGPKIPVLFTGRINDPVLAEELIKGGYCDLVGMTRAGIADPEFPNKAREGRLIEIRRCIACNRCIGGAQERLGPDIMYKPTCSVNPMVGNELHWKEHFRPADKPKRVVVVGGGPAGCETARVAAMRGHKVTLFEQGKRLGGQMLIASKAPGRDSFEDQIYYEENELARLGVDVRLQSKADLATIKGLAADTVVIATGSTPRPAMKVIGNDLPHVVQGWDVLMGKVETGAKVAIVSQEDYFQTPNVAEFLAERGKQVTVFHKSTRLGNDIDKYSIGSVMKRLEQHGIKIVPGRRLAEVLPGALKFASAWGPKTYVEEGFDTVVLVYGSVPNSELYDQIKADGAIAEYYIVGSAWLPRRIAEATQHGASIGLLI